MWTVDALTLAILKLEGLGNLGGCLSEGRFGYLSNKQPRISGVAVWDAVFMLTDPRFSKQSSPPSSAARAVNESDPHTLQSDTKVAPQCPEIVRSSTPISMQQ